MTAMMYRLTAIRRRIDDEIRTELARPMSSALRLLRLRRLHLLIREKLTGRMRQMA